MKVKNEERGEFWAAIRRKVSAIRIAKNYSARNLSLELGRSSEYVNQLENGYMHATLPFLYDFCNFFGLSLSEFFDSGNAYPVEFKGLLSDLSRLSSDEVNQIAGLAKSLARNKR